MVRVAGLLCIAGFASGSVPALAWGSKGHRMINYIAARALPASLPAFMRTQAAANELAFLGPEEDDLKGSGREWDAQNDPGHYVDVLDDGTIAGDVKLDALPSTREAYDTGLRAAGSDQYKQGFLPYSILDGWEQLRMDFAYWRVDAYRASHGSSKTRLRAAADRAIEQRLILRDAGVWGHFVADASQPLHVTVHFNGWGDYPNPGGYSTARTLHAYFESTFVNRYVTTSAVTKLLAPLTVKPERALVAQDRAMAQIESYLEQTNAAVVPLYTIEKTGGFESGSPQAVRFCSARIAAGASELRDLIVWAWDDSLNEKVGYPAQPVRDVLQGAHA
ncbi:MAG TPA: hypothetical protein VIG51_11125 [Candidatus Baltobacteraceae bacterium]|jgi:hypothetical protein